MAITACRAVDFSQGSCFVAFFSFYGHAAFLVHHFRYDRARYNKLVQASCNVQNKHLGVGDFSGQKIGKVGKLT